VQFVITLHSPRFHNWLACGYVIADPKIGGFLAWQVRGDQLGYAFSVKRHHSDEDQLPMTSRVALPPQDFQKMCKQAEREQEARRLVVLMDRVRKQIAERGNTDTQRPVAVISADLGWSKLPSRSAPFER
jgi:hypothetical protein